jgi:hypothetical protein
MFNTYTSKKLTVIAHTLLWSTAGNLFAAFAPLSDAEHRVVGDLMQWHKTTVELGGPSTSETATPNPFFDYRMEVTFSQGATSFVVPGYFAADGDAANTGATSGNVWRAHFSAPTVGEWDYEIDFYQGTDAAPFRTGTLMPAYSGLTGSFTIAPTDKTGADFRGKGLLRYVGKHYLRFQGSEDYFFYAGPGDPENLLGYSEFDNTPGAKHDYRFHDDNIEDVLGAGATSDWNSGDPTWGSGGTAGRGKDIIGMINYLASTGANTSYILLWAGGDAKDAYPWADQNLGTYETYDVSKLDQWEIVFAHMEKMGIHKHLYFLEAEIDNVELDIDPGTGESVVGRQFRTYYREMVARFGHHNAITWNLGEEINASFKDGAVAQDVIENMGAAIYEFDPYGHPIGAGSGVMSAYPDNGSHMYNILIEGDFPWFTSTTVQKSGIKDVATAVQGNREQSVADGKPIVVSIDEQGWGNRGIDYDPASSGFDMDEYRKEVLWEVVVGGGAGVSYYFGPNETSGGNENDGGTLTINNMRLYDQAWTECGYAVDFLRNFGITFWIMNPDNDLVTSGFCLANPGNEYVIYLPNGGTTELDLTEYGADFSVQWYDPRNGGGLTNGSVASVTGGGSVNLGSAPDSTTDDWVILVRRTSALELGQKIDFESLSAGDQGSETLPIDGYQIENLVVGGGAAENIEIVDEGDGNVLRHGTNGRAFRIIKSGIPTGEYIEAEAYENSGATFAPLEVVSDPNASNGDYIVYPDGTSSLDVLPSPGHAEYSFTLSSSALVRVWLRVVTPGNQDDSFWVRINDGTEYKFNQIEPGSSWHWDQVHDSDSNNALVSWNLGAGTHTLRIGYREDGARLDRIYIATDATLPEYGNEVFSLESLKMGSSSAGTVADATVTGYRQQSVIETRDISEDSGNLAGFQLRMTDIDEVIVDFANGTTTVPGRLDDLVVSSDPIGVAESWINTYFPLFIGDVEELWGRDSDGDGLPNIADLLTGGRPDRVENPRTLRMEGMGKSLRFYFDLLDDPPDGFSVMVQRSTDLETWNDVDPANWSLESTSSGVNTWSIDSDLAEAPLQYYRLSVRE